MSDALITPIGMFILTTIVGILVWRYKRFVVEKDEEKVNREKKRDETLMLFMEKSDEKISAFMASANENTKALIGEMKQLTKVVNNQTTQTAIVMKSLEFVDRKIDEHDVKFAELFQKTDVLEKEVSHIQGVCEARH